MLKDLPFDLESLRAAYARGASVADVVREVYRRIEAVNDPGIFITLRSIADVLEDAAGLGARSNSDRPLWGIPFVIKDNIDAAGMPTTAACPAYAYGAADDAQCVQLLRNAGALLVGKTNLDQFATGLVGVRTPYPVPRNAIDPKLVPGGSSSGSAVAVAQGLVTFSLGTDTAGSGRVPAGLNNIVGLKPTLGAISARGVVPACRTLDTVSVFALSVDDAYEIAQIMARFDADDAYSRSVRFPPLAALPPHLRVGVPDPQSLRFFGDGQQKSAFQAAIEAARSIGGTTVEIDLSPFYDVANLLYTGSWIAERYTVTADLLEASPEAVHPTTRAVVEIATGMSAADAFRDRYRLAELRRRIEPVLSTIDLLMVPTYPAVVTLDQIAVDPITPNAQLGTYTNFVNLLDLCGIAVPAPARADGLPGTVTLLAQAGRDALAASFGRAMHENTASTVGGVGWAVHVRTASSPVPCDDEIELAVVGAHMSGLPLNGELTRLGARFLRTARTAPDYRLYALAGGPPHRPGLIRTSDGQSIELETWALPKSNFGAFMAGVPQPLGIGTLTLDSNEKVKGFLCEAIAIEGAEDVTRYGGWRAYLAAGQ